MDPIDQVIDEIRQIRHRISEECGHDPKRLVEYFQKLQERHKDRLYRPKPRSIPPIVMDGILPETRESV